jgi:hypothetical protein
MTGEHAPELAIPGTLTTLPCGCQFWNQALPGTVVSTAFGQSVWSPADGTEFVIRPCGPACMNYRSMLRMNREHGNQLQFRKE